MGTTGDAMTATATGIVPGTVGIATAEIETVADDTAAAAAAHGGTTTVTATGSTGGVTIVTADKLDTGGLEYPVEEVDHLAHEWGFVHMYASSRYVPTDSNVEHDSRMHHCVLYKQVEWVRADQPP